MRNGVRNVRRRGAIRPGTEFTGRGSPKEASDAACTLSAIVLRTVIFGAPSRPLRRGPLVFCPRFVRIARQHETGDDTQDDNMPDDVANRLNSRTLQLALQRFGAADALSAAQRIGRWTAQLEARALDAL